MRCEIRRGNILSAIAIRQSVLEKMEHAIGFDFERVKRNRYTAYRNYYVAPKCDDKDWKYLVSIGYAEVGKSTESCIYYHVTNKGMDFIERVTGVKILDSD